MSSLLFMALFENVLMYLYVFYNAFKDIEIYYLSKPSYIAQIIGKRCFMLLYFKKHSF